MKPIEPFIKILYSESPHPKLQMGVEMPLGEANSFFEYRDIVCEENKTVENVIYEVSYLVNGEVCNCLARQYLGDGEGSVINHLRINALNTLKTLEMVSGPGQVYDVRSPFSTMRTSCENLLSVVLPQLEAYCVAYKTADVISSFSIVCCNEIFHEGVPSIMRVVQNDPQAFIGMLNEIIAKHLDDISLVSAVETLIYKTERYHDLIAHKEGDYNDLVGVLEKATQKAIVLNENSILNQEPPPERADRHLHEPEYCG